MIVKKEYTDRDFSQSFNKNQKKTFNEVSGIGRIYSLMVNERKKLIDKNSKIISFYVDKETNEAKNIKRQQTEKVDYTNGNISQSSDSFTAKSRKKSAQSAINFSLFEKSENHKTRTNTLYFITLAETITIPPGNYYLTVKRHFRSEEKHNFFLKNLGDDKLEKVNKAGIKMQQIIREIKNEDTDKLSIDLEHSYEQSILRNPIRNILNHSEFNSESSLLCTSNSAIDQSSFLSIELSNDKGISDDLFTNIIILSVIKSLPYPITYDLCEREDDEYININSLPNPSSLNLSNLLAELISFKAFRHVVKEALENRVKKLHERIFLNSRLSDGSFAASTTSSRKLYKSDKFFHLSCTNNDAKKFKSIVGTFKQIYCPKCFVYNCRTHLIKESTNDFDSGQLYDMQEYTSSYSEMIKITYSSNLAMEIASSENRNRSNNPFQQDSLGNLIKNKINEYNKIIKNWTNKQEISYAREIVVVRPPTTSKVKKIIPKCSRFCWRVLVSEVCSDKINEIYMEYSEHELDFIRSLYFKKLFKIFKFDPCIIYLILKNIHNKPFNESNDMNLCECTNIFIMLLKINLQDFFHKNKRNIAVLNKALHHKKNKQNRNGLGMHRLKNINEASKNNIINDYIPCLHKGNESCGDSCPCAKRGYCEKYCICNPLLCTSRFKGCACTKECNGVACPCFANGRECDPEICKKCCLDSNINAENNINGGVKKNIKGTKICCVNQSYSYKRFKRLAISHSMIEGWGVFALENIKKDELITEYLGEMLEENEVRKREIWNEAEEVTYMFKLTEDCTIDSKFIGNKARFANHSKARANAYAKILFAHGDYRVCLYANREIKKYQEIFFDYDGQGVLERKFSWINDEKLMPNSNSLNCGANKKNHDKKEIKKTVNSGNNKSSRDVISKKRNRFGQFVELLDSSSSKNSDSSESISVLSQSSEISLYNPSCESTDKNLNHNGNDDTQFMFSSPHKSKKLDNNFYNFVLPPINGRKLPKHILKK